jgi:sugar phosphate isomerase/epimerase
VDPPSSFGSLGEFGRALPRVRDIGFVGAELSLTHPLGFEPKKLRQAADDAHIAICSLMTGWSYFNEGLCLSSADSTIRDRAISRLLSYVEVAAQFEAMLVFGQMQGFLSDEPNAEAANERIVAGLRRVCHEAAAHGVRLAFEPVNHLQAGFNNTVAEVVDMVRRVGSPSLKPMVDTIHLNIEECSVTEPILRLGQNLGHVHLCETNGGMFGTGHLDFEAVFRALAYIRYDQYVSVKIYRGASWEAGAEGAMAFLQTRVLPRMSAVAS